MAGDVKGNYEYMPESYDFEHYSCLGEDLRDFYELLEKYKEDKTQRNKRFAEKQLNDLFFTIKHLVIDGSLSTYAAAELQDYVGGLFDDQL